MHLIQCQGTIAEVVDFPLNSLRTERISYGTGWAFPGVASSSGAALKLARAVAGVEQGLEGQAVMLGIGVLMSRILLVEASQMEVAPTAVY